MQPLARVRGRRSSPALAAALVLLAGCATDAMPDGERGPDDPACRGKCDGPESRPVGVRRANLLANLIAQMDAPAVMFGQQRFNVTGVEANGQQWLAAQDALERSDAHTLTGQHPAVLGLDAWDLAIKPESWTPNGSVHAAAAKLVHARGGVVTMDWHMRGCVVDSYLADANEACLCRIANDDAFARSWLLDGNYRKLADALATHELDTIPIVFRPLHEHNGGWFWWGEPYWNCAAYASSPRFTGPAAYERVFRTIVTYLRDERGLDNLLIAYSPNASPTLETDDGYLRGYPGDAYVDVLGADLYYKAEPSFAMQTAAFRRQLATVTRLARARGKAAALTETGNAQLALETTPAQSRWFTDQLLPLVRSPGVAVAYALTWENRRAGANEFWVPYDGHPGVADFRAFTAHDATVFLDDVVDLYAPPASGFAVCASCASDGDGDGWGWENAQSCRLGSWCLPPAYPPCARCASDPDGDGWGWEDARSCIVLATCQ